MTDVVLIRARGQDDGYRALPFGILAIAGYLEKNGINVDVIDMVKEQSSPADVVARLSKRPPGIVGISAMTSQSGIALELCRLLKSELPVKIVLGGVHFTALPEEGAGLADAVIVGEGEVAMLEYCRYGGSARGIIKGEPVKNLDDIPFPSEERLRPLIWSEDVFSLMSSRGCPFNCLFCLGRAQRSSLIRNHSIDSVLDFITMVADKFGVRKFFIEDDIFVLNKKRVLAFCDGVKKRGLKLEFNCFTHVGQGDLETYTRMKEAGFNEIPIGIESGNDSVLKAIKKAQTVAQARETVRLISESGLTPYPLFMLGNITETEETIRDTIKLARELMPPGGKASFGFAQPYPGSEFREVAAQYGQLVRPDAATYWNDVVSFVPNGLTEKKLQQLMGEARQLLCVKPAVGLLGNLRRKAAGLFGNS